MGGIGLRRLVRVDHSPLAPPGLWENQRITSSGSSTEQRFRLQLWETAGLGKQVASPCLVKSGKREMLFFVRYQFSTGETMTHGTSFR